MYWVTCPRDFWKRTGAGTARGGDGVSHAARAPGNLRVGDNLVLRIVVSRHDEWKWSEAGTIHVRCLNGDFATMKGCRDVPAGGEGEKAPKY